MVTKYNFKTKPFAHQLEALEPNSSDTEVSTADSVEDNYRIIPGDSQKPEEVKKVEEIKPLKSAKDWGRASNDPRNKS